MASAMVRFWNLLIVAGIAWTFLPSEFAHAGEQHDTNLPGIVAEVTECKRKDGVLTVRLRLTNKSDKDFNGSVMSGGSNGYDQFYATAGAKKYFILRDTEKTPLAPAIDPSGSVRAIIRKDGSWTWWAKYPAPPADVVKITYFTPFAPPIEDVPITE